MFGPGVFDELGILARDLGLRNVLILADPGIAACGYVARATMLLQASGIAASAYSEFGADPDSDMIAQGRRFAASLDVDGLIAIGGGSSMDFAKGLNFILTNHGSIADYRGYGNVPHPMLPMIGVPTTAGTGSEAQSYAVISDARTKMKMACGAPGAAFRVALLDPRLTRSQPRAVAATAGYDALSHVVESFVTKKKNELSRMFGREAWRLISRSLERALTHPDDERARGNMLIGAHYAGAAIEASMLGAAHACANPLSARYGLSHGIAVSLMLPWVVRWNASEVSAEYAELLDVPERRSGEGAELLAARLDELRVAGDLPESLSAAGVRPEDIPVLARDAAAQWTGKFNPRRFSEEGALELYTWAL